MPTAPPRACNRCKRTVTKGQHCTCQPQTPWRNSPQRKASGRRWQNLRRAKLQADPICQSDNNCRRPAETVDHVIPLAENGPEWDWHNLQSLCHPHHREKTAAEARRGARRYQKQRMDKS